jgi:hypothetical protein
MGVSGNDTNDWRRIFSNSSGGVLACQEKFTLEGTADSVNTGSVNTWTHLFGAWRSQILRESFLNGNVASKGTNATDSGTQVAADITVIGNMPGLSDPNEGTAGIAEVSMWDLTGFTTDNIETLANRLFAGRNPINLRNEISQPWTGLLTAYVINSSNTITDLSGNGNTFTMQGTLTDYGSHPSIDAVGAPAVGPTTAPSLNCWIGGFG